MGPHAFIQVHWCMCIACTPTKHITSTHGFMLPRWWVVSAFVYFLASCLDCCCQLGLVTWSKPAANVETLCRFHAALFGANISYHSLLKTDSFHFLCVHNGCPIPGPSAIDIIWTTCKYDLYRLCLHLKASWVWCDLLLLLRWFRRLDIQCMLGTLSSSVTSAW